MIRNSILFAIALTAMIAFAGSAQASVTAWGDVNSTAAEGEVVTVWLDVDPGDYVTVDVLDDAPPNKDYWYVSDLEPMLDRNGYNSGDTSIPVTATMYCSGTERDIDGVSGSSYTNTYRNVTVVYLQVNYTDDIFAAPLMELEPCPTPPDLNVSEIILNPGDYTHDILYGNDTNNISAVIWNNGTTAAGPFNVSFVRVSDELLIGTATVPGLNAGTNTTVYAEWVPPCVDYPVESIHPVQAFPITINVTADCDNTVIESDEGNNTLLYDASVVNVGLRSKNFDCNASEDPLDEFKYYDGIVGGGLVYDVSGGYDSTFNPTNFSIIDHQIILPSGATVLEARLYVYAIDKHTHDPYAGALPNLKVNFSGDGNSGDILPDAVYYDTKGFGKSQRPRATSVFNVTDWVSNSVSDYTVNVTNNEPLGGNITGLCGEILTVVYEGADGGDTVQVWILEGADYLVADHFGHGAQMDYGVSPAEATATVGFAGIINTERVNTANLIAVSLYPSSSSKNLLFNGDVIKGDAWSDSPANKVSVEDVSVTGDLAASNTMGFQDTGSSGMAATNAFLVVTLGGVISCDASGNSKNEFAQGEKVYAKGVGLSANTNYTLWLQNDPVYEGYALAEGNCTGCGADCPGQTGVSALTDADGCFTPKMLWNISATAPITYKGYDIIADNQDVGSAGICDLANDGADSIGAVGFVAPVPELSSIMLLAVGLLMLAGLVRFGRKE